MDIAFCINDKFVMPCGVLMLSIMHYNNAPITFHVFGNNISEQNKDTLKAIAERKENYKVRFHTITRESADKIRRLFSLQNHFQLSEETYYRLFIADSMAEGIRTVLYLDADMICTGSLDELFHTDLNDRPVGMCLDKKTAEIFTYNRLGYNPSEQYFNSGTMLINADYWKKNNVRDTLLENLSVNYKKYRYHDQDLMNAVYHGRICKIDPRYNVQPNFFYVFYWMNGEENGWLMEREQFCPKDGWAEIRSAVRHPAIIHFCGAKKPWHKESAYLFTSVWRYFYAKSPWKEMKLKSFYGAKKRIKRALKSVGQKLKIFKAEESIPYPPEAVAAMENILRALENDGDSHPLN